MIDGKTIDPKAGSGTAPTDATLKAGIEMMREPLKKVAATAEVALALANHLTADGPCWRALSKAIGELRKALRPEPGSLAFMDESAWYEKKMVELRAKYGAEGLNPGGDSPAEAQSRREEEPLDPNAPDEKKAVGNFAGQGKVVSYAIDRDMAVTVTASTCGDGTWNFKGTKDGRTMIAGSIFGGKWQAIQYCKFIRNGIVSRFMKIMRNHTRRAEKAARSDAGKDAAAALAGARSDAGKAVAE